MNNRALGKKYLRATLDTMSFCLSSIFKLHIMVKTSSSQRMLTCTGGDPLGNNHVKNKIQAWSCWSANKFHKVFLPSWSLVTSPRNWKNNPRSWIPKHRRQARHYNNVHGQYIHWWLWTVTSQKVALIIHKHKQSSWK